MILNSTLKFSQIRSDEDDADTVVNKRRVCNYRVVMIKGNYRDFMIKGDNIDNNLLKTISLPIKQIQFQKDLKLTYFQFQNDNKNAKKTGQIDFICHLCNALAQGRHQWI